MRTFSIILVIMIGLFGLRLLFSGLRLFIMFFKVDAVPPKCKVLFAKTRQTVIRELILGVLLLILALAMII